jgi:ABC-type lipopolysaccharide export system ATPase subunit
MSSHSHPLLLTLLQLHQKAQLGEPYKPEEKDIFADAIAAHAAELGFDDMTEKEKLRLKKFWEKLMQEFNAEKKKLEARLRVCLVLVHSPIYY